MPRFFRRLAFGVFDEKDLKFRTDELASFIEETIASYDLVAAKIIAVGYSNGANIAASLLLLRPGLLRRGAISSDGAASSCSSPGSFGRADFYRSRTA